MMRTGDIVYSTDGETFNYEEMDFDLGDTYFKGTVVEIRTESLVPKNMAAEIVERMEDVLYGECGEWDALSIDARKVSDLQQIIVEFMKNHCSVACYKVENVTEHTVTEDDLA